MVTVKSVKQKLKRALENSFPKAELRLSPTKSAERVWGFLIWNGFTGKEQMDRQDRVWKVLDKALTKDEQAKLSVILTATPNEMKILKED